MNTPFLDEVYDKVDFDRDLVFKFFTVFSLFEYALKIAGFRTIKQNGEVQPNWNSFANNIHQRFNHQATAELAGAVNYLLNRPVMIQVVQNANSGFAQRIRPQNISDTVWLSMLIRGVRNNLFHGGKFRYDRPRDPELIKSSLIILESWAQLHTDVERELRNVQ